MRVFPQKCFAAWASSSLGCHICEKVEQIAADLWADLRYSMDHLNHRSSLQIPGISNAGESRSYVRNTCLIYLKEAKVNVDLTK